MARLRQQAVERDSAGVMSEAQAVVPKWDGHLLFLRH